MVTKKSLILSVVACVLCIAIGLTSAIIAKWDIWAIIMLSIISVMSIVVGVASIIGIIKLNKKQ